MGTPLGLTKKRAVLTSDSRSEERRSSSADTPVDESRSIGNLTNTVSSGLSIMHSIACSDEHEAGTHDCSSKGDGGATSPSTLAAENVSSSSFVATPSWSKVEQIEAMASGELSTPAFGSKVQPRGAGKAVPSGVLYV